MFASDGPPTAVWTLREMEEVSDDAHARKVVDLASRTAALTLTTGGSNAEATAAALQVAAAYQLTSVHVDVSYTSVIVSHHRGPYRDANTLARTVAHRAPDYERLSDLQRLLDDLPELEVDEARARFDKIVRRSRHYRRWVMTIAAALLGVGVALLFGGGWVVIVATCLTTGAVDLVTHVLSRKGVPEFFGQIAGAAIPTVVAVALMALGESGVPWLKGVSASVIVAAGVVALLAGLSVVSAAQDAIDGFMITAGARTFHVAMMTLGIVMGILVVLWAGSILGLPSYLNPSTTVSSNPLLTSFGAVFIALGFAIGSQTRLSALAWCAGLGLIGWWGYLASAQLLGLGHGTSVGIGATVAAFLAQLATRPARMAAVGLTTAGVIALLPGSMVYRGLYGLVQVDSVLLAGPALIELLGAGTVAIAIAMGVSLGTWLGRWATRQRPRMRFQRKAVRQTAGANSRS